MRTLWIVLGVVVLLVVLVVGSFIGNYNSLVTQSEAVDGQWAQVEVQLQRRFDLIPNLVETVKGYAAHEQEIFTAVADARARMAGASSPAQQVEAANQMESALGRLLVVVENYPDLKADSTFQSLFDELAGTENRLATERMRFNNLVRDYNTAIRRFPAAFYARMFGFFALDYLQTPEEAQGVPDVTF